MHDIRESVQSEVLGDRIVAHAGHVSSRDELDEVDEDGQRHVFWDSSVVPKVEAFFGKLADVSSSSLYEGEWSTIEGYGDIITPGSLLDRAFGANLTDGETSTQFDGHARTFLERQSLSTYGLSEAVDAED